MLRSLERSQSLSSSVASFDNISESNASHYDTSQAVSDYGVYERHNLSSRSLDAQLLLGALEKFIRPVANVRSERQDGEGKDNFNVSLSPEAQALVTALKNFILSIVNAQPTPQEELPTPVSPVVQASLPTLPSKFTDALRAHVFNHVPIRLLTFDQDGTGIKLIERNAIYDNILRKIHDDLGERGLAARIQPEFTSANLQGQPLHPSPEKAEEAVTEALIQKHSRYAILSHTWIHDGPGEVTYSDWHIRRARDDTGYLKLSKFCKVTAQRHKLNLAWMDTICINKQSSSELDESIRSMYKWYENSHICITYLSDTTALADMANDRWFTRGWTLQELLAPRQIKFYNKTWKPLTSRSNDRHSDDIRQEIKVATTITSSELSHKRRHTVTISRKMQWAASREVTREEDSAYSLLGIFGVSISIAYGEGLQRAFFRLVEAILASSQEVWDIFNCARGCAQLPDSSAHNHHSAVIPCSPKDYLHRSSAFDGSDSHSRLASATLMEPITLTHLGVRMRVLFIPAQADSPSEPYRQYRRFSGTVTVNILKGVEYTEETYNLFPKTAFYKRIPNSREIPAFCVFNFDETTDSVYMPSDCLAFGFQWSFDSNDRLTSTGNRRRMITKEPVVLKLRDTSSNQQFRLDKKDLATEGLQLFTLHL